MLPLLEASHDVIALPPFNLYHSDLFVGISLRSLPPHAMQVIEIDSVA